MAISIQCPAKQSKGPFPVARNASVTLSVTSGGSAVVQYIAQPQTQQSVFVDWPNGTVTTEAGEVDVAENNYLAMVTCTLGTATLAISDPDPLNALPYNNWKTGSQVPLISSTFAGMAFSNDGSTAVWSTVAGVGGNLPAINSNTAFEGLYNNGTTAAWGPRIDWFVTANTATAAGIQAAVDRSLAIGTDGLGYPEVRLIPGMHYVMETTVAIYIPSVVVNPPMGVTGVYGGFRLACPSLCLLDGSGFTSTNSPMISWTQGSGNLDYGHSLEGIIFSGNAGSTRAIDITGTFHTIKNCHFDTLHTGLTWLTYSSAVAGTFGFTEQCTGENLTFRSSCQRPVMYRDIYNSGQRSFRGTGLIGKNVVAAVGPGFQFINIGPRCLVYMAPLNIDISSPNTSAFASVQGYCVVANDSDFRNQNFYGTISSENSVNTPITFASSYSAAVGGPRTVWFTGQIQANRNFFRLGSGRIGNQTLVTVDEAQISGTNSPFIGEYHTTQDCGILNGGGVFFSPWQVRADTEIFVRINSAAGLDLRYVLNAAEVTGQVANTYGTIAMNRILYEEDPGSTGTFSDGGVTFGVNSLGSFTVTAPNVTNTACFLFLDCTVKGQPNVGPTLNTLRFRNDMYYVCHFQTTYIDPGSFNVISNPDGGNFGKGQSVSYFQVGTSWLIYDAVNGTRTFTVTSFTKVNVDSANIGSDIVLDPSLYGVAVYSWVGNQS